MFRFAHALRRPTLACVLLAGIGRGARAEDAKPPDHAGVLSLGTPIPPAAAREGKEGDAGVGLRSLDANGPTYVALRTDGRILVATDGVERIVDAPENGEEFRTPVVAGDGIPVVVTTRGRIALLEPTGARFLKLSVQRSAKPTAIAGSIDVVFGSENGSLRRLVRTEAEPRLVYVLEPGDEPVGTLAASSDRVVYFRYDGVALSVPLGGGEPTTLLRPARMVRAIRFAGGHAFAAIGGEVVALEGPEHEAAAGCSGAGEPPDVDSMAVTADSGLLALLAAGVVEVRRLADGARVRSDALSARRPIALAWSAGGGSLLVATSMDARHHTIPVERGTTVSVKKPIR